MSNARMLAAGQGLDAFFNSAVTNTDVAVKTRPGKLYGYHVENPNASKVFVQFFDALIADVTVGTTTPKFALAVPASGVLDHLFQLGVDFDTAITIAVTTAATNGVAPGAACPTTIFYY